MRRVGFCLFLAAAVYLTLAVLSMEEMPPLPFLFGTPMHTVLGFCALLLPAFIGVINLIYGLKKVRK